MEKANLESYMSYDSEHFTKRVIFKDQSSAAFVLNFKPGQALPAHQHPGSTVYLQVISGTGEFTIDGKAVPVKTQDLLTVAGNEELAFTNVSKAPISLYVILTKTPSEVYAKDI